MFILRGAETRGLIKQGGKEMIIYQWSGQGKGFMSGINEYIQLYDTEDEFTEDYDTEEEAIEASTAPGFEFDAKYDTEVNDLSGLPMGRILAVKL